MTYRRLGRLFRFETSIQKDHELVVSGPYSVVRHPSYTALILFLGGWFPWNLSKGSWIVESGLWDTMLGRFLVIINVSILIAILFFVLARMSKEDITLRNQFGKKWDDCEESSIFYLSGYLLKINFKLGLYFTRDL